MKKALVILVVFLFQEKVMAQNGYTAVSVSGGLSVTNSKYVTISLEKNDNKKLHTGLMIENLFYSNYKSEKIDLASTNTYYSIGLFLAAPVKNSRNYSSQFYFGGATGTDFHRLIYYPFAGLSHSFFVSPKSQLFITEKVQYIFKLSEAQWQPCAFIGFRYLL